MATDGDPSSLDRSEVIDALDSALRKSSFIHALWEGGAAATGTLDEWSDLDLYVLVDDDRVEDAFSSVEDALSQLSPISLKLPIPSTGWAGVHQAFYRLRGTSEYHIIDLAIVTLSAEEKFLEPTVHGEARFVFNKLGTIEYPPYDSRRAEEQIARRRERLADRLGMFGCFFNKEVSRGNTIEAADLYNRLVLPTLVELLRMKHMPAHYNFGTRHVHSELPGAVIDRLVRLCFYSDMKELVERQREAREWIADLLLSFR